MTSVRRGQWRSRLGFILAAAGSAVGLGNIWKFPYVLGQNGGSVFLILYLVLIAFLGLPILIGEVMVGKASQKNPVGAFKKLDGARTPWQTIGFMGVVSAFVILSFYSVVAGWCVDYILKWGSGAFQAGMTADEVGQVFGGLTDSPLREIVMHGVFISLTIGVVVMGVEKGLQRWCEVLMPGLILILVALIVYALGRPGAMDGVYYLLKPAPENLKPESVLAAMGQCFFSLSLGMGAMMTYGSYLRKEDGVVSSSVWVVLVDTGIALLAGFVIFPIVFAYGAEPAAGPGLVFVSLPLAFLDMPGGQIVALAFFSLLLFAALTSAISLLEVITAYFVDEFGVGRGKASIGFGSICFVLGAGCAYSDALFDAMDNIAFNYMLPLGALFISLFVGWRLKKQIAEEEFSEGWLPKVFGVWLWCVRIVAPALMILVFLNVIGVVKFS